jgi:HSP20 family protein
MVVSLASHHSRFSSAARNMVHWVDEVFATGSRKYCPRGTWSPAVNLYEDSACYYVVADLAGVDADDMELRVEKSVLVLVGHRNPPDPADLKGQTVVHLMEIDHGNFCRTVQLPAEADAVGIEASYRNGLLWIRIPRKENAEGPVLNTE